MTARSEVPPPAGGGTAAPGPGPLPPAGLRALRLVAALFVTESLFQLLLPISLADEGRSSGALVGVLLALSQGAGLLVLAPVAARTDRAGRRGTLRVTGPLLAVCSLVLALVETTGSPALWVVPVLLYGFARGAAVTAVLGEVAHSPQGVRVQGFNGAVQRLTAAVAVVIAAVLLARGQAWIGYAAMAGFGLLVWWLAAGLPAPADPPPGPLVDTGSYRRAWTLLRGSTALQASSLVSLTVNTTVILGNSFYLLVLDVSAEQAAVWVLALLLCRDVASVLLGPAYRRIHALLGMTGVLVVMGGAAVSGLLLVALTSGVVGIVLAAVLQGASVALGIASTNLLAIGDPTGGLALRLAATNYVNLVGCLLLPLCFGLLASTLGPRSVFVFGAAVAAVLMAAVLVLRRRA